MRPRGKESKLTADTTTAQEWMQNIPDVTDMFELKSYDELSKIINDWLNDDADGSEGTERSGGSDSTSSSSNASQSSDTESSSYKSLDDAFADLME